MTLSDEVRELLVIAAKDAARNAYAPYSNFKVGAALVNDNDQIFAGANVENASYGLTVCAERNAIFSSIAEGNRSLKAILVYTPNEEPVTPCGACRQVIREFSDKALILSICNTDKRMETRIDRLLPMPFGRENTE